MIKVLHFIDSMNWGGAETLVLNTVELLNEDDNYNNFIVTMDGGALEERAIGLAEYYSIKTDGSIIFSTIKRIRELFQSIKPDIIHSHLLPSTLLSRIILPSQTKLVSTYHSKLHCKDNEHYSLKYFLADKLSYKSSYFTIYVSESVKRCIATPLGIKSNHKVIPNFAHPKFTVTAPRQLNGLLRLIAIGRLTPQKNFSMAISALGSNHKLKIKLDIFGTGYLKESLLEHAIQQNANVTLKGAKEITSELLSEYDAFLMTSIHEGMPVTLIEALRAGTPCILSNIPELVETAGPAAIYFDVNNTENLAEKLRQIMDKPSILTELRKNAIRISQQYEPELYIRQLKDIYKSQLLS